MKKIALVILLLVSCLSTFAKQKHKKKHSKTMEITAVTMHRTACFGRCPEYQVEIDNDGMATYTAIRFCKDSGIFKKNIGMDRALEMINEFRNYRVDTCQDLYESRVQDLPGIVFTIKYKDTTKVIRNANFGPRFLTLLAQNMDYIGKKTDDSWKKAEDTGKK